MRGKRLISVVAGVVALVVASTAPASAEGEVTYLTTQHYGSGTFTGTVAYEGLGTPCDEPATGTFSITAQVAFTNGTAHYEGPLVFTGTGLDDWCGGTKLWPASLSASGTDLLGHTFVCPTMAGAAVGTSWWVMGTGGDCTLDGTPVPRMTIWFEGAYATTASGPGTESGTVAGTVLLNTY